MSLFKRKDSCCDDGERDFEATVSVNRNYASVIKRYTVHAPSRAQAREIARKMFLEDIEKEARVDMNETTP